ncbi:hypothetical protein GOC77_11660 [Haloarcula argentinensis]|uniref:Uncharacterized protein n=1 Tax=Haloarcula argentinensis TaxID=43776 RepID=A0A847UNF3_HALAR|nr:hypothetical protein [Haloarcula argentinensis]
MGAEIEFQRPRRAVLFDEVPVRLGDLVGIKVRLGVAVGCVRSVWWANLWSQQRFGMEGRNIHGDA